MIAYNKSQDLFIAILSVDSPKYIERSKTAINNINKKLKIPLKKINVFRFPPVKKNESKDTVVSVNHQKIIRYALKHKYKYALIFEDDVDFEKNAAVEFAKAYHNATTNYTSWGILYLGCHTFTPIYKVYGNLYKGFYFGCAHAYMIREKAMSYIANLPIDTFKNKAKSQKIPMYLNQIDLNLKIFPKCNPIMMYPSIAYQTEQYRAIQNITSINVRQLQNKNNLLNSLLFNLIFILTIFHILGIYKGNYKIYLILLLASTYNIISIALIVLYNNI